MRFKKPVRIVLSLNEVRINVATYHQSNSSWLCVSEEEVSVSELAAGERQLPIPDQASANLRVEIQIDKSLLNHKQVSLPKKLTGLAIEQYLAVEQAALFPELDVALWLDFVSLEVTDEQQQLMVYVLEKKKLQWLLDLPCLKKTTLTGIHCAEIKDGDRVINFLPWRAQARKHDVKVKSVVAVFSLVLGVALSVVWSHLINSQSESLQQQVNHEEKEMAAHTDEVHELTQLNDKKKQLLKENQWMMQARHKANQALCFLQALQKIPSEKVRVDKVSWQSPEWKVYGSAADYTLILHLISSLKNRCDMQSITIDEIKAPVPGSQHQQFLLAGSLDE